MASAGYVFDHFSGAPIRWVAWMPSLLMINRPSMYEFSLFNTEDYLSPAALAEWKKSRPDDVQFSAGPRPRRKPAQELQLGPVVPRQ
jgi:hypothetical protein